MLLKIKLFFKVFVLKTKYIEEMTKLINENKKLKEEIKKANEKAPFIKELMKVYDDTFVADQLEITRSIENNMKRKAQIEIPKNILECV